MYHKKRLTVWFILTVMTGAAYAAAITDVMVRQRWPWSRKVDIEYILECQDAGEYDIVIKAYNGNAPLTLPEASLSGDIHRVRDGARRIVWDPLLTPYVDDGVITNFRVELELVPVPLYMIIDLTKSLGDPNQIEYVYESDLTNGIGGWGDWVRNPVTNNTTVIESVIWTGVNNGTTYKKDKIVLRRVRAGSYKMGGTLDVTLTREFYIGVFQITQGQWAHLMGPGHNVYFNDPATQDFLPMETVSYNNIRGTSFGAKWPGVDGKGDYRVDDTSFMGLLRARVGMEGLDLPTEAQWEYACRAGTTTYYNDGNINAPGGGGSAAPNISNIFIDVLGRYRYNGGFPDPSSDKLPDRNCGPEFGTAIVGTYRPNAWGLYDMHGNINEWCLDWAAALVSGNDPIGPIGGTQRVYRGGRWSASAEGCSTVFRTSGVPSYVNYAIVGLRLVKHLP